MEIKPKELWNEIYGDVDYSFDFANKLIIKDQYKTQTPFSWESDRYDFDDEKSFIANIETIKLRDKKPVFEIDNLRYIVTRNPDYSYSILSPSKISDENCPINFDLFLNNKINNYEEKYYSFIIISIKKMNMEILNIFNNYIVEYVKIFKNLVSFDIDNSHFSRSEIKIQFLLSDDFSMRKTLEIALTISSLMPLIIHRFSSLNEKLWSVENDMDDENYYNLFVTSRRTNENPFALKNVSILGRIVTFENSIFIDEETKKEVIKKGIFENSFVKAINSVEDDIYQYKFSRVDISQYNEIVISKSK